VSTFLIIFLLGGGGCYGQVLALMLPNLVGVFSTHYYPLATGRRTQQHNARTYQSSRQRHRRSPSCLLWQRSDCVLGRWSPATHLIKIVVASLPGGWRCVLSIAAEAVKCCWMLMELLPVRHGRPSCVRMWSWHYVVVIRSVVCWLRQSLQVSQTRCTMKLQTAVSVAHYVIVTCAWLQEFTCVHWRGCVCVCTVTAGYSIIIVPWPAVGGVDIAHWQLLYTLHSRSTHTFVRWDICGWMEPIIANWLAMLNKASRLATDARVEQTFSSSSGCFVNFTEFPPACLQSHKCWPFPDRRNLKQQSKALWCTKPSKSILSN